MFVPFDKYFKCFSDQIFVLCSLFLVLSAGYGKAINLKNVEKFTKTQKLCDLLQMLHGIQSAGRRARILYCRNSLAEEKMIMQKDRRNNNIEIG